MTRWLPRIAVASLLALLTFSTAFAASTKLDAGARSAIYLLQSNARGETSISSADILSATASGELVFHIFSALAQFERRLA